MNNVVPIIPNTMSLDEHIKLISKTWEATSSNYINGVFKTGRKLQAALEQHGNSLRSMADKLPFSWQMANRLMLITEKLETPGVSPETLPPAWTILYELSKLPEKVMLQALKDGRINPNMKKSEAIALKPKKPKRKKSAALKPKSKSLPAGALTLNELKSHLVASLKRMKHGKRLDAMSEIAKDLMKQFPDMDIKVYGNITSIKIGG